MAVLAGLICAGCNEGPTEVRFLDLVATRGLRTDGEPLRARETLCSDETWVAVTLEPGRPAAAALDLRDQPVLTLAGCLECEDGAAVDLGGSLLGTVRSLDGRGTEFRVNFDVARGWWEHEVDLGQVANRQAEIELEAELPESCVLRLREATVRQLRFSPEHQSEPPLQVLLISVDTLRRDAIGTFGGLVATPHLDRFAAEAEIWTRHYAAASWTKPSHASMLTGYHPSTHRAQLLNQAMDPAIPTLAERFRVAGFSTAALVFDCGWLSPRWGFSKGFDGYQVSQWRAGRQARAAANWVLERRGESFFFFLHTFEPHADRHVLPYEAPGINQQVIAEVFGVEGFGCRKGLCSSRFLQGLVRGKFPFEPQDVEILRHTYGSGVQYLDESLRTLFDTLRRSGMWDQMLIVVTSDHGEEFIEHGGLGHKTLYDEILRVPLLIKWPDGDRAGVENRMPCSAVDLAPTLLEFAGLPTGDLPGTPLHRRDEKAPVFAGTLDRAVVADGYKAIFGYPERPPLLFHLTDDPGELTNLAESEADRLRNLEELVHTQNEEALALYRRIGSGSESGEVVLSPLERERLEAFGYLVTPSSPAPAAPPP